MTPFVIHKDKPHSSIRVVFVQKDVFAKPAVMALSAMAKQAGHRCFVVIADLENDPVRAVAMLKPQVIAFSITTAELAFMRTQGPTLRAACGDAVMICGGPHPTFYPEVIDEPYLDAVCRGEGDEAFPEFLNALASAGDTAHLPNFWVKKDGRVYDNVVRPLIDDLDHLPFYDRDIYTRYGLYAKKGRDILYHRVVMAGRGCPKACAFCFNQNYNRLYKGKGRVVRRRSVPHLIAELRVLKQSGKVRFITLDDDSFTLAPRSWLVEFCSSYERAVGLPFKINSTADALDEDLVKRLKRAGCHAVKMGLESGNERVRNLILSKNLSEADIVAAAGLLKKHGIRFQTFNMVCCPEENMNMALETYALNRRIRPDFVWCSLLNPYPGTAIFDFCKQKGWISSSLHACETGSSYFTDSPLLIPEKQAMVHLQKLMNAAVILNLPERVLRVLVRLPLPFLYRLIFGAGMTFGLCRINKGSWRDVIVLSFRYFFRYNRVEEDGKP